MGVTLISSFEAKLSETVQKMEKRFQSSGGCPFHEVIHFASSMYIFHWLTPWLSSKATGYIKSPTKEKHGEKVA